MASAATAATAAATAATAATAAATAGAGARLRPIQLAVMGGHTAVLEHLLQAGAAADVEAEDGRQLIHLAALSPTDQVTRTLALALALAPSP